MDYKKKYEDALSWMRDLYPTMVGAVREDAEHYFPELAESEDERIRKMLVEQMKNWRKMAAENCVSEDIKDANAALDWLEKQKEQKPIFRVGDTMRTWDEAKRGIKDGLPHIISINSTDYLCNNEAIRISEQGDYEFPPMNRQQPAEWGEEDEIYLQDALWCIKQAGKVARGENDMGACWSAERWLKSLKDRIKEATILKVPTSKPKTENEIIDLIEYE